MHVERASWIAAEGFVSYNTKDASAWCNKVDPTIIFYSLQYV